MVAVHNKGIVFYTVEPNHLAAVMLFAVGVHFKGERRVMYVWSSQAKDAKLEKILGRAKDGDAAAVSMVHAFAGDGFQTLEPDDGITYLSHGADETKTLKAIVILTPKHGGGFTADLEVTTSNGKRFASIPFAGDPPTLDGSRSSGTLNMVALSEEKTDAAIQETEKLLHLKAKTKK